MQNEEILTKALKKAINNGYNLEEVWEPVNCRDKTPEEAIEDIVEIYVTQPGGTIPESDVMRADFKPIYKTIIFNHDFAKAFWEEGKRFTAGYPFDDLMLSSWEYHLMRMVLEEEPLKYLEKFL